MLWDLLNKPSKPNSFTRVMGELIRKAREEKGLSQEALAEVIYRRRPAISEMENGKMEPDATTLALLAINLEKPIEYFFPPKYLPHYDRTLNNDAQELLIIFNKLSDSYKRAAIQQLRALATLHEIELEDYARRVNQLVNPDEDTSTDL